MFPFSVNDQLSGFHAPKHHRGGASSTRASAHLSGGHSPMASLTYAITHLRHHPTAPSPDCAIIRLRHHPPKPSPTCPITHLNHHPPPPSPTGAIIHLHHHSPAPIDPLPPFPTNLTTRTGLTPFPPSDISGDNDFLVRAFTSSYFFFPFFPFPFSPFPIFPFFFPEHFVLNFFHLSISSSFFFFVFLCFFVSRFFPTISFLFLFRSRSGPEEDNALKGVSFHPFLKGACRLAGLQACRLAGPGGRESRRGT